MIETTRHTLVYFNLIRTTAPGSVAERRAGQDLERLYYAWGDTLPTGLRKDVEKSLGLAL